MTEEEWLAATEPTPLVAYVRGLATGRQLAMAAIALCRSDRDLMRPGYSRDGVAWSERVTDGEIASDDLGGLDPGADYLMGAAANRCRCVAGHAADGDLLRAHDSLAEVVGILIDQDWDNARRLKRMAEVFRCIFGNPFRPITFNPSYLTPTVLSLAKGIYEDRAFDRMPVLADALQDAGCDNEDILTHCRGPGPHVRGCWVVDLCLGKT
ncbi:hypothetical protein [Fimbriiglobus ruber]|uniref:hypothetical protein n=1 Tax=Fimbriiglobus ruber TaxID=1908690 RepID=UPI001EE73091|nr:hypothetical protein [Fimbriiglobus ruber]